jgi:uncharacterized membrane protein YdjX (TVP38/TMEM64 family)
MASSVSAAGDSHGSDALVDDYGGWAVLVLRLVPVMPFTPR